MDKLIKLALASRGFTSDIMDNIILVAEATDNKVVALELLLGIYEWPSINPISANNADPSEMARRSFMKYDPIKDQVHYQVLVEDKKTFHFKSQEDMDKAIDWDRGTELRTYKESEFSKEFTRTRISTSYCSLSRWQ
jgi:hypothetical protein